ncbi:hypothetical protein JCM11491_001102 [Sporobolomyces phaffii]
MSADVRCFGWAGSRDFERYLEALDRRNDAAEFLNENWDDGDDLMAQIQFFLAHEHAIYTTQTGQYVHRHNSGENGTIPRAFSAWPRVILNTRASRGVDDYRVHNRRGVLAPSGGFTPAEGPPRRDQFSVGRRARRSAIARVLSFV